VSDQDGLDEFAPFRQTLADLLATFRKEAGLTQEQLAVRLGWARSTVAGAEKGYRLPGKEFWAAANDFLTPGGDLRSAYAQLAAARQDRKQRLACQAEAEREAKVARWRAAHNLPVTPALPTRAAEAGLRLRRGRPGEEQPPSRREVTRLLAAMVGAASSQPALDAVERLAGVRHTRVEPKLVAAHREVAEHLAMLYRSADPQAALPMTVAYADSVLELLDAPTGDRDRVSLAETVVGVHAQVGLWACHLDRPGLAYRYLATACDIAKETPDRALRARAFGAFAYLFSSAPRGGYGGNPRRALGLFNDALALGRGADGFTRGWLATWRADQLATLGNVGAARADVDAADRWLSQGDGDCTGGFFGRPAYGYGMVGHLNSVRAVVLALAGESDEADRIFAAVQSSAANMRRRVATYGHVGLVQAITKRPEEACAALGQSVRLAVQQRYGMGVARVAGVRAGFPPDWHELACVRELDDELAALAG
jgi:hypothetical protein